MDREKFDEYLRAFNRQPRLTKEEESALALRAKAGDKRAKERLFACSLRWAAQVARIYGRRKGVPLEEAFSAACEGMTYALTKFDPERGRFSTYSVQWMRCHVGRYVRPEDALNPPTGAKFSRFRYAYARARNATQETRYDLVRRLAESVRAGYGTAFGWADAIDAETCSIDAETFETGGANLHDLVAQDSFDLPETQVARREEIARARYSVRGAMRHLSPRDRKILERTEMQDEVEDNQAVANDLGVSRERVRQLRDKAKARVGEVLRKRSAA